MKENTDIENLNFVYYTLIPQNTWTVVSSCRFPRYLSPGNMPIITYQTKASKMEKDPEDLRQHGNNPSSVSLHFAAS